MSEWGIIVLRTVLLFFLVIIAFPLFGRKSISSMTMLDFILVFVSGSMIALIALNVIENLAFGLIALLLWTGGILALQYAIQKSKWAHQHIAGKEIVVIKNGKILEENLHVAKMTGEELLSQLRRKDIFSMADVEFAVLEANGDITTLLKRDKQPVTPNDLRVKVNEYQEPQTVMLDGNILDEPLTTIGLNRDWLLEQLQQIGVAEENIFLAQVDSMGELYIDTFDDVIQIPQPSAKALLLATLKKLEAQFRQFSFETQNPEWKSKYEQHAQQIHEVLNRLEPYLDT
ncbi:DUF421 domain-containing protein [Bacillus horti]|uniref:Uncharacterized membrane protein YcaP (DUF421 family) n=1 Tax=Caldalkalibacillus horti TaxID=77523 RepID=A0ABT9VX44_9BACI|nr:DUF421 domain-containing protein [Bacillus horti]MDQ0165556.1 uncharacterized membrane protein YcaP (DUF421 family) [Bacillus horti]